MTRFERAGSLFAGFTMAFALSVLLFPDLMRAILRWML